MSTENTITPAVLRNAKRAVRECREEYAVLRSKALAVAAGYRASGRVGRSILAREDATAAAANARGWYYRSATNLRRLEALPVEKYAHLSPNARARMLSS